MAASGANSVQSFELVSIWLMPLRIHALAKQPQAGW
jgi:hypothetical protein